MPKRLGLCLAILLIWESAYCGGYVPFVSGALQYDVLFPLSDITSPTNSGYWHEFASWGSEFSAGVTSSDFTFYAGYHFVTSSVYGESSGSSAWQERRALLGARWHMNGSGSYPVKPTIGVGISYGSSALTQDAAYTPPVRRTSSSVGQLLEFGLLIRMQTPVDISVMSQFQRYRPTFDTKGFFYSKRYVVLAPGWQIGIRYRIPGLKL